VFLKCTPSKQDTTCYLYVKTISYLHPLLSSATTPCCGWWT